MEENNPKNWTNKWISIITTYLDIRAKMPYEIDKKIYLREAKPEEHRETETNLCQWNLPYPYMPNYGTYTSDWPFIMPGMVEKKKSDEKDFRKIIKNFNREDWRFWLIESPYGDVTESERRHSLLNQVLLLVTPLIELGLFMGESEFKDGKLQFFMWGYAEAINGRECKSLSEYYKPENVVTIEENTLEEVSILFKAGQKCREEHQFIVRALEIYEELRSIPADSDFMIVGYFSIIELLITHMPSGVEMGDSIRRQIHTKMKFFREFYGSKVNPTEYFREDLSEKNLWNKLYDYRSVIAHGGFPEFKVRFQCFENKYKIRDFLKENIVELLRFALTNPKMVENIKPC